MTQRLGLSIRHHTGFTYDGVAKASYNEARMTPRSLGTQQVQASKLTVRPAVPMWSYTDYFGTIVNVFDIQETHPQLEVEAVSHVESWAATLEAPLAWGDLRSSHLVDRFSEFLLPTRRTAIGGVADLAPWQGLDDVHQCAEAVADFVRAEISYVPGATTVSATGREFWRTVFGWPDRPRPMSKSCNFSLSSTMPAV